MFFPLTALSVVGCLIWARTRDGNRSAIRLALYAWGLSVALCALPLLSYRVEYSLRIDAFVAACLIATTGGYFLARRTPRAAPANYLDAEKEAAIARILAVAGVVGCALLLFEARASGTQFSLGFLLENLSSIRASTFDSLAEGARPSALAIAGSYLAACSLLAIIAAVNVGGRWLVLLAAFAFLMLAAVSVFVYGGRATLFLAVLLGLVSWYLSGKRIAVLRLRTWIGAAVALIVIGYFSVSWVDRRQGSGFNPAADLAVTQRAEYHPLVAPLASRNDAVATGLLSVGYFASSLPTLTFYTQQTPMPGPYLGSFSFPLPARMLDRFSNVEVEPWLDIRAEVFAPLERTGYFGNVWATWLRDLLVDFGYFGALLFCLTFGWFMAWARNRYERTGALHYHYLEVIACLTSGFGAFTSYLWFTFLAAAFFVAVGVGFVTQAHWARPTVAPSLGRGAASRS